MKTILAPRKLGAAVLCLLFAACTATRYPAPGPASARELAKSVLVIEESPDGQVVHSWMRLKDFDLTNYPYHASHGGLAGRLVRVTTSSAQCEARQQSCIDLCTNSPRPIPIEGVRYPSYQGSWAKNRGRWCESTCTNFYQMCLNGRGPWAQQQAREFTRVDLAIEWLKVHREEIVTGTLVVIAGVAFVAAVGGSGGGLLFFVPLMAVASADPVSELPADSRFAEVLNVNF
ncbi:hypothetical protein KYC5002_18050 [Archangium violaceum]|uniref:hypothetical protein n=1 Tax=Archangium violaceum TaxID=83451 RepID=UPI002B31A051|nr:hypothetical protein KYC5002_18050 [Archangium gephyra]